MGQMYKERENQAPTSVTLYTPAVSTTQAAASWPCHHCVPFHSELYLLTVSPSSLKMPVRAHAPCG